MRSGRNIEVDLVQDQEVAYTLDSDRQDFRTGQLGPTLLREVKTAKQKKRTRREA